jgi:hypothetical protein
MPTQAEITGLDLIAMHCNRWLSGRPGVGFRSARRAHRGQLDRLAAGRESSPADKRKGHAPRSPGPVDTAVLQSRATALHEAINSAKCPG